MARLVSLISNCLCRNVTRQRCLLNERSNFFFQLTCENDAIRLNKSQKSKSPYINHGVRICLDGEQLNLKDEGKSVKRLEQMAQEYLKIPEE